MIIIRYFFFNFFLNFILLTIEFKNINLLFSITLILIKYHFLVVFFQMEIFQYLGSVDAFVALACCCASWAAALACLSFCNFSANFWYSSWAAATSSTLLPKSSKNSTFLKNTTKSKFTQCNNWVDILRATEENYTLILEEVVAWSSTCEQIGTAALNPVSTWPRDLKPAPKRQHPKVAAESEHQTIEHTIGRFSALSRWPSRWTLRPVLHCPRLWRQNERLVTKAAPVFHYLSWHCRCTCDRSRWLARNRPADAPSWFAAQPNCPIWGPLSPASPKSVPHDGGYLTQQSFKY